MSGAAKLADGRALPANETRNPRPDELQETQPIDAADYQTSSINKEHGEKEVDQILNEKPTRGEEHRTSGGGNNSNDHAAGTRARSWRRTIDPLKRSVVPPVPSQRGTSREYGANVLSALSFQWIRSLLAVGYQRPLELNDIWQVNPDREVDGLAARFQASLDQQQRKPKRPWFDPVLLAMFHTFTLDFVLGGLCQFIAGCTQVFTPFVLKYLIEYVQTVYNAAANQSPAPGIGRGLGLVFGIAAMQLLQSLCTNQYYYRGMMLGGQARSVMISTIFTKALKLSGRAKVGDAGWSSAKINNLMSTDTSRIDLACATFHRCWVAPIQVVLALILLCLNLGPSALVGFGLICLTMPVLARAIKALMTRRKAINKLTDERIQLTQDAFTAIRTVKLFTWEPKLLERLSNIRGREINKISHLLTIRNAILATAVILPIIASMLTFITYSLLKHDLNPAPIFSSLALFNALGVPLEVLPLAIGRVVDALASIKRISQFFDAEELQDSVTWDSSNPNAVTVAQGDFTWEQTTSSQSSDSTAGIADRKQPDSNVRVAQGDGTKSISSEARDSDDLDQKAFAIRDINLSIGRQEFVAVIGSIGSGKSSLLSALAGEMRKTAGVVTLGGSRALCSQHPWIQNASLKQNILFGKSLDEQRYQEVVSACALQPDIDMLPHGDATELGERGVTISGGQKQRISLARAVYFDADVVLLDDPLSAVDSHVGRHLLDNVLCRLLATKCRIMATHQLHILARTDKIIWMKDGVIHKTATFTGLMQTDSEFRELMKDTRDRQADGEEETVETGEPDKSSPEAPHVAKEASHGQTTKAIAPTALMQEEEKSTGSVKWSVYTEFMKASGSAWNFPLIIIVLAIAQGANIVTSLWLSWWTSSHFPNLQTSQYIGVYAALGAVQAILMFTFATTLTTLSSLASRNMVNNAVAHTMRAPVSFFDTTPTGRLMNRFSKDVDTMDNRLQDDLRFLLFIVATITSVFALIIAYYYYFAVALVPLGLAFVYAAAYYRASAREIKRYESLLRSLVFSRFGEGISGSSTIRAYSVQSTFAKSISTSIDSMNGAYYLTFAGQRWLSVRLDTVSSLLVLTVGILIVTSRFNVSPSIGGLVLSYMLSITQLIQEVVHVFANVENEMNSTERLYHYGHNLEQEPNDDSKHAVIPSEWPSKGSIRFSGVEMRYRQNLPLVLKGLSFNIKGGERIGIVGRTGAGKSSIITALFRLVEPSLGHIELDGVDIASVPLPKLRSSLSIIPQDPVLFKGTVRSNLDPFDEYEDLQLWDALRQTGLLGRRHQVTHDNTLDEKNIRDQTPADDLGIHKETNEAQQASDRIGLDSPVDSEGHNFSLGERQLLALARVLLRKAWVTVFDEATSAVDLETDNKVQQVIVEAFKERTLLCIAHRLKTILGYDRVLVMDEGVVAEYDSPLALFDAGGIFRSMCERSDIVREDILIHRDRYRA